MNYICFSPYFPLNYFQFSVALKKFGVNVLGIGDAPYEYLHPELKAALTEYYRLDDLHNYDQLLRAVGYLTHRYGKIDGIDSHNEYWLDTEAQLRRDFHIDGLKPEEMSRIKKKSEMKNVFQSTGLNTVRGIMAGTLEEAIRFAKETGYPLMAKPDSGVGAAGTYKIEDEAGLKDFFNTKPQVNYLLEEFIVGDIFSFDGLVDKSGNLIFFSTLKYGSGVMEIVQEDAHVFFYTLIDIPEDLVEAGKKILAAFAVKGRFFHFEFFREHQTGKLVALEVNMRPPGGFITEMFNFTFDVDVYNEWAAMIVNHHTHSNFKRKYHVCYVSRKWKYDYYYTHETLMEKYSEIIVFHHPIDEILSRAMGNYCYLLRSSDLNAIFEVQQAIHQLRSI
jgi:hypothetical protein